MVDDAEFAVLKEQVGRLLGWRHRILDTVPVGVFLAVTVATLWLQLGIARDVGRLEGSIESRFDAVDQRFAAVDQPFATIDRRLAALEQQMVKNTEVLIDIARTLGRLEGSRPIPQQ